MHKGDATVYKVVYIIIFLFYTSTRCYTSYSNFSTVFSQFFKQISFIIYSSQYQIHTKCRLFIEMPRPLFFSHTGCLR